MNIKELEKRLLDEKIPSDEYSLKGGLPNEAFCIAKNQGGWEIYYSERGIKSQIRSFNDEDEACSYFYKWLIESLKFDRMI